MREMGAGEFKTHCLAVMDEVQAKRESVLITKRGKPVAKLVPIDLEVGKDPIFGLLRGKAWIIGDPEDLIAPIVPEEDWRDHWEPEE